MPDRAAAVDLTLVGRTPNGDRRVRTDERVRIVPLPSIGHPHADHAIRRVLIEVATSCSLNANDIAWAFSGIEPINAETGEVLPLVLVPTQRSRTRCFRSTESVRPSLADVVHCYRGSITRIRCPATHRAFRQIAEAKGASERSAEQERAAGEVLNALRHAQVRETVESICVQREPFEPNGLRAEVFADETVRKERLWHVKVRFAKPLKGPIVIGDGRFLGLGVMAPSAWSLDECWLAVQAECGRVGRD